MLFLLALSSFAEDKTFLSEGQGATERLAIQEALITAMLKHYGIAVSFNGKNNTAQLSDDISEENFYGLLLNNAKVKGKILGFDVISSEFDKEANIHKVKLLLSVPGKYAVGADPDLRRRMVVNNFQTDATAFSIYGYSYSAKDWTKQFTNELNQKLTASQKFTMLDRTHDAEIEKELAQLTSPNASSKEYIRLNQKLGTDYLVVGSVTFYNVAQPPVNPFTNQVIPQTAIFADVNYRMILAPTGQLKYANTVRLDPSVFPTNDVAAFMIASATEAASFVAESIISFARPVEIVSVLTDGSLVLGGKFDIGAFGTVYEVGEVVYDNQTHEALEQIETEVGVLQIYRTTEKLSYAKCVQGDVSKMKVGSRVRANLTFQPQQPAQQPAPTGVIVPF